MAGGTCPGPNGCPHTARAAPSWQEALVGQAFVLPARAVPTLPVHPKKGGTPGVCVHVGGARGGGRGGESWLGDALPGRFQSSGDVLGPGSCSLGHSRRSSGWWEEEPGVRGRKEHQEREPRKKPHLACDNHTSRSEGHKGVSQVVTLSCRRSAVLPSPFLPVGSRKVISDDPGWTCCLGANRVL